MSRRRTRKDNPHAAAIQRIGSTTARPATDRSPGQPTRVPFTWHPLALVVAGLLVYANSLSAPFVFDDTGTIVLNPFLRQLWPLTAAWRAPVQSAVSGRPVVALSLAISHAMGGLDPATFRAWNIAVLIFSALLLFGILRRIFRHHLVDHRRGAEGLAFASALIWLVHPLQTELVDYVTQRTESMMGMLYLLTFYATVRAIHNDRDSKRWTALAITACTLGMASKESMATAPLMMLLYDVVFEAGSFKEAWRRRKGLYVGLASTWLVLAALVAQAPRWRSAGLSSGATPWTYLLHQAVMIVTYLRLSVWPQPLVLDYGPTLPIALRTALPPALVVLSLLAATAIGWWKRPAIAFLGIWFFVTLAPSSSVIPIATEVGAERRMYLPLAAIVVIAVVAARAALQRMPAEAFVRPAIAGAAALAVVSTVLGALAVRRNAEYHSPPGLWLGVVERRPTGRAHHNLAIALKDDGRTDEAIAHYRQAAADEPAAHYALGFELASRGSHEEAVTHLREFIRRDPDDQLAPKAQFLLGQSLTRLNRKGEAAEAFRQVLQMRPRDADASVALADLLLIDDRYADAIPLYRNYLSAMPDDVGAHHNLGLSLLSTDQTEEAIQEFQRSVTLKPADPDLSLALGHALAAAGRLEQALTQFERGLKLAPSHIQLMSAVGVTLAAMGKGEASMAMFGRALQLAPTDLALRRDYQAARAQIMR
jgi:tetratricopeptide (TPR) repeat protein